MHGMPGGVHLRRGQRPLHSRFHSAIIQTTATLKQNKTPAFLPRSLIFRLTVPTCAEFENGKSPLLPIRTIGNTIKIGDYRTTDENERYNNSTYGLLEERLKDKANFPLNSM